MLVKSKSHLVLIGLGTLLSAFSLGCIVKFTDPYTSGIFAHLFFYVSFFMFVAGLAALTGIILRLRFAPGLYINHLAVSFRQAVFVAFLTTLSLFLQSKSLLFWWVGATLFLFILSLEIFLNTK